MAEIIPYDPRLRSDLTPLLQDFEREVEYNSGSLNSYLREELARNVELTLRDLDEGRESGIICVESDLIVGFALLRRYNNKVDRFRSPTSMELTSEYVAPNFRRRGIARKINLRCIETARETSGVDQLVVAIESDNVANIALKKKLRFRRAGQYGGQRTYEVFRKQVT